MVFLVELDQTPNIQMILACYAADFEVDKSSSPQYETEEQVSKNIGRWPMFGELCHVLPFHIPSIPLA